MSHWYRGGLVRRYHTIPLGAQSVGEHSWGVATIIARLNPDASADLLRAALYHDLGEQDVGDVPAQVKWGNPDLVPLLEALEKASLEKQGLLVDLTQEERSWLKGADMLELMLYGTYQLNLGNQYALDVLQRGAEWFKEAWTYLPDGIREAYKKEIGYGF